MLKVGSYITIRFISKSNELFEFLYYSNNYIEGKPYQIVEENGTEFFINDEDGNKFSLTRMQRDNECVITDYTRIMKLKHLKTLEDDRAAI